MSFINKWIEGIVIAVIISSIMEMIVPNGNNKKYIKVVIGIYILFTIISPIVSKFNKGKFNINDVLENTVQEYTFQNYDTISTTSYIRSLYIENVKSDIKDKLKEKGFVISNIDLTVSGEAEYTLESVNIKVHKEENNIKQIEKVKINISDNKDENIDNLTEDDIINIKEYICSLYDIKKKNISINEKV